MPPTVITVPNAGRIAQALGNEKCQRILDYLQKREDATETQLANALNIPLSTVHYNMKVLSDSKLVIGDQYTYSSRGKEVTHYRRNPNPIVIVQEEAELSLLKAIVPAAVIAAGAAIAWQLTQPMRMQYAPEAAGMLYAPAADESARSFAMDAAPMMAKAAPEAFAAAPAVSEPSLAAAFALGALAVLVLSLLTVATMRWWRRRS